MNTLTATTAYSSGTAASPRSASRPLPQARKDARATPGDAPAANWLERLATWYESRPTHRRVGSYTLLLQLRAAPGRAG